MGYDFHVALGSDTRLRQDEVDAIAPTYAAMVAGGEFPHLGVVGHSGSDGLGCGIQDWALEKLRALSLKVPARTLALWCVYCDLSGIERVTSLGGVVSEVEVIVRPDN